MSKDYTNATKLAGMALENALNSASSNTEAVEVAEMFVTLGTAFLRSVCGEEYAKAILEAGLVDMERPSVLKVVRVEMPGPGTKH
jgi:hypothetical protein